MSRAKRTTKAQNLVEQLEAGYSANKITKRTAESFKRKQIVVNLLKTHGELSEEEINQKLEHLTGTDDHKFATWSMQKDNQLESAKNGLLRLSKGLVSKFKSIGKEKATQA